MLHALPESTRPCAFLAAIDGTVGPVAPTGTTGRVWLGMLAAFVIVLSYGCNSVPADDTLLVRIVGDNYQWHIYLPGDDGVFGTADDRHTLRELHLPVSRRVRIELSSRDFIYSFNLPEYDIWEAAVPGVPMTFEFDSGSARASSLLGDQFCGFSHEQLLGQVFVHEPADYADWLGNAP